MTFSSTAKSFSSYGLDADNENSCFGFQMTVDLCSSGALELQPCSLSSMADAAGANSNCQAVSCAHQANGHEAKGDEGTVAVLDSSCPGVDSQVVSDDNTVAGDISCGAAEHSMGADSIVACAGSDGSDGDEGCCGGETAQHWGITEDDLDELIEFWDCRGAPARRLGNVVLEADPGAARMSRRRSARRSVVGTRKLHLGRRRNHDFMENERAMEKQVAAGAVHYDLKRIMAAAGMSGS